MACLPLFYIFCPAFCPFVLSFSSLVLLSPCSSALFRGLLPFLLFILLSWLCGLAFGVGWVVVSFSLSDGFRHKKKGRKGFAPCVLACPVVGCVVVILSLQFGRLRLYTPSRQHCKLVQNSDAIRFQHHRSKQR